MSASPVYLILRHRAFAPFPRLVPWRLSQSLSIPFCLIICSLGWAGANSGPLIEWRRGAGGWGVLRSDQKSSPLFFFLCSQRICRVQFERSAECGPPCRVRDRSRRPIRIRGSRGSRYRYQRAAGGRPRRPERRGSDTKGFEWV